MPASTLQISFSEPSGNDRLLVRLEAGVSISGEVPFHIFPSDHDRVAVTRGDYRMGGNRSLNVVGEIIKFESSDRAQLKYPGVDAVSIQTIPQSIFRASDLTDISPIWTYDKNSGEVIAIDPITSLPVQVVGGAAVSYSASYTRYFYTPDTMHDGGVFAVEYGSIIAIKNKTVETLEISASTDFSGRYVELFHVYSQIVIANSPSSARDVWELPDGYPESSSFPNSSEGPDPENSVAVERVHEIGYVNDIGSEKTERFFHANEKPYFGASTQYYTPKYKLRWHSAPDGYEDAFGSVDQSAIRSALSERYPGL